MSDALPVVAVWRDTGDEWAKVAQVATYTSLTFTPTFQDVGSWSMTLPYDAAALPVVPGRLITIDWRDVRTTWLITEFKPSQDDSTADTPTLTVAGVEAKAMLAWTFVFPDPTRGINNQPVLTKADPPTYKGSAEWVVRSLVAANLRDRYGLRITIPPSQGRGSIRSARAKYQNLLELVTAKAKLGGIGFDIGLVNTTTTRADLTFRIWLPEDKTRSVRLTTRLRTVSQWEQTDSAPTATMALVASGPDNDRTYEWVSTPKSRAAAAAWGGSRQVYVAGPSTTDMDEIVDAGEAALLEGAETRTLSLTATEAAGMRAFTHYNVGDKATAEVAEGAAVVDSITSIEVAVGDSGVDVKPTFGDPNAKDSSLRLAQIIRAMGRSIRNVERN